MDNPQPIPVTPRMPSHRSIGKAFAIALGYGLLLAIPLTVLFMYGAGSIISYFRLSYHWGLAGIFVPFAILFYAFCGNAILMILASFITLTRSSRPFLHALLIGLIINILAILGGWGVNLVTHQGELAQLKAERNNDSYVDAKGLADCAKLTDVNYWRSCIKDKVTTEATQATCEQQVTAFASTGGMTYECLYQRAVSTASTALCANVPVQGTSFADQRYCIMFAIEKSWEKNNRVTPLSVVTGCASITDATEKQFCYSASLRQLNAGDPAITAACTGIDPTIWFGHQGIADQDRTMVETKCRITITAP